MNAQRLVDAHILNSYTTKLALAGYREEMTQHAGALQLIASGAIFEQCLNSVQNGVYFQNQPLLLIDYRAPYFTRITALLAARHETRNT